MTAYYRPTESERRQGWVPGLRRVELPETDVSPSVALDDVLRECLLSRSVAVSFSGGIDSSLVLASATRLARREDLPLPLPVTRRFRNNVAADEAAWQELVIEHLDLPEWRIQEYDDDMDFVGPASAAGLRAHGVVFPAPVHPQRPFYAALRGHVVLTGEGGDEVLGRRRTAAARRVAHLVLRRRGRPSRGLVRQALLDLAPRRLPTWRPVVATAPWLTPDERAEILRARRRDESRQPLFPGRHGAYLASRRAVEVGLGSVDTMAREHGVQARHPLLDVRFLGALDRAVTDQTLGRATLVHRLFPGLLPPALLRRPDKAHFGSAYFHRWTRDFAARWSGEGLGPLVDATLLRAHWLSPEPDASTALLLQEAWCHDQGVSV